MPIKKQRKIDSYNYGCMDTACSIFSLANKKLEKYELGIWLSKQIKEGRKNTLADLGGGEGSVLENLLRANPEPPKNIFFLEPTNELVQQAQKNLSPWTNKSQITYIHKSFEKGIDKIPDNSIDFMYESNALPNFGTNLKKILDKIYAKLSPNNGVFYSILPLHKNDYGKFNAWAFTKISKANNWDEQTNDDNATLVYNAAQAEKTKYTKIEHTILPSTFFYPLTESNNKTTVSYLLVFLFNLRWKNIHYPPKKYHHIINETEKYLKNKKLLTQKGITMKQDFQILKITRFE